MLLYLDSYMCGQSEYVFGNVRMLPSLGRDAAASGKARAGGAGKTVVTDRYQGPRGGELGER